MRKVITLLSIFILSLANISSVSAAGGNEQKSVTKDLPIELTVFEEHQGVLAPSGSSYKEINKDKAKSKKSYKIKQKGKQKEQRLYEVVDGEDLPYTMVIDVHGDQSVFQAVGEMAINTNNIEKVKKDDRISPELKSDLDKLVKEIKERQLTETTLTVYSPNLLASDTSSGEVSTLAPGYTWTSPTYWWGEGGYKYKLETLMIDNYVSDTADKYLSSNLEARNLWSKVFENTFKVVVDAVTGVSKVLDIPSKIIDIIPFPSDIGGNTGDRLRAYTTEDKNIDYYSIQIGSSFTTRAIGDQSWHRWVGITIIDGYSTMKQSNEIYKRTPNFTNLAHYCYLYRSSSSQYREYLVSWNYFGNVFTSPR